LLGLKLCLPEEEHLDAVALGSRPGREVFNDEGKINGASPDATSATGYSPAQENVVRNDSCRRTLDKTPFQGRNVQRTLQPIG
jgi:hypothetical protein